MGARRGERGTYHAKLTKNEKEEKKQVVKERRSSTVGGRVWVRHWRIGKRRITKNFFFRILLEKGGFTMGGDSIIVLVCLSGGTFESSSHGKRKTPKHAHDSRWGKGKKGMEKKGRAIPGGILGKTKRKQSRLGGSAAPGHRCSTK